MKVVKLGWRNRSIILSAICVAIFIVFIVPGCMHAGRAPEPAAPPAETTTAAPTEPTSFVPSPHIHDFNDFGECRYCGYIQ